MSAAYVTTYHGIDGGGLLRLDWPPTPGYSLPVGAHGVVLVVRVYGRPVPA